MRLTIKQDPRATRLQGIIQWFSKEKGYGFINGNDGVRRFFHVTDTADDFTPEVGNFILFEPRQDRKGPRAIRVCINPNSLLEVSRGHEDGRVSCPHCSRPIVPRMTFWYGRPNRSFCPYCAGEIRNFFRDGALVIVLDMMVHVAFFSAYVMTFLVGLYFLMTADQDSGVVRAMLGCALIAPTAVKLLRGTRRRVFGLWRGTALH
jgi:cold shock CspA family protein